VLIRGVIHHQIGDNPQPFAVRGIEKHLEIVDRAVVAVNGVEFGDVIPVILQRRGVHREKPDTGDAEIADVIEALDHA